MVDLNKDKGMGGLNPLLFLLSFGGVALIVFLIISAVCVDFTNGWALDDTEPKHLMGYSRVLNIDKRFSYSINSSSIYYDVLTDKGSYSFRVLAEDNKLGSFAVKLVDADETRLCDYKVPEKMFWIKRDVEVVILEIGRDYIDKR